VLTAVAFGVTITIVMIAWYLKSRWEHNPISFMVVSMPAFVGTIAFGLIAPYITGVRPSAEKLRNLTLFTLHQGDQSPEAKNEPQAVDGTGRLSLEYT
jgi:hypothetical protein